MRLIIYAVGRSKTAHFEPAISEYSKRLSRHAKLNWQIIPSSDVAGESARILKLLPAAARVILLDEHGRPLSSPELAQIIEKSANASVKKLVFIIGGAYGVSDELRRRADLIISLSSLTFPHELVRLILSEQLYRAYDLLGGGNYHHA